MVMKNQPQSKGKAAQLHISPLIGQILQMTQATGRKDLLVPRFQGSSCYI